MVSDLMILNFFSISRYLRKINQLILSPQSLSLLSFFFRGSLNRLLVRSHLPLTHSPSKQISYDFYDACVLIVIPCIIFFEGNNYWVFSLRWLNWRSRANLILFENNSNTYRKKGFLKWALKVRGKYLKAVGEVKRKCHNIKYVVFNNCNE